MDGWMDGWIDGRTWRAEYRALRSDVEYSAEYRTTGLNKELYIRFLNLALNIDREG